MTHRSFKHRRETQRAFVLVVRHFFSGDHDRQSDKLPLAPHTFGPGRWLAPASLAYSGMSTVRTHSSLAVASEVDVIAGAIFADMVPFPGSGA